MTELIKHFTPLLEHNLCNIAEIPAGWVYWRIDFVIWYTLIAVIWMSGLECLPQRNFGKSVQMCYILSSYCL
jgi:hypothetical protein